MLRGEKVTLRGATRKDLHPIWQCNNDLALELAGGGDPPEPQALERLQADFDSSAARGGRDGVRFAIEAAGVPIGLCSLMDPHATHRTAMLGIGDRAYWGRGGGREAVRLLLEYVFRYRNLRRVWLWVHADKERAIRAHRAGGFVEEGRLREHVRSNGRYVDVVHMGVLRDEWEAA